jgi:hypothetical protein
MFWGLAKMAAMEFLAFAFFKDSGLSGVGSSAILM